MTIKVKNLSFEETILGTTYTAYTPFFEYQIETTLASDGKWNAYIHKGSSACDRKHISLTSYSSLDLAIEACNKDIELKVKAMLAT